MTRTGTARVLSSTGVTLPPGTKQFVTVPAPPSANNLFATVRGRRVKSADYRYWLKQVVPVFRELAPPSLPCKLNVTIDGEVNERRDGGNFQKPIEDALVAAGVIPDDSLKYLREGWWKRR